MLSAPQVLHWPGNMYMSPEWSIFEVITSTSMEDLTMYVKVSDNLL